MVAGNSRAHIARVASLGPTARRERRSGKVQRRPIGWRPARSGPSLSSGNWHGRNSLAKPGMRSRACRREASRNVQGPTLRQRPALCIRTCHYYRQGTSAGDWRHAVWFFFVTGAAIFTGLCLVIRLELWLGLAPRQTQNPSSARHADRHHRCRRMPTTRHPGLCRSLKAPARSRLHAGPSRPGTALWPDIPSGRLGHFADTSRPPGIQLPPQRLGPPQWPRRPQWPGPQQ